MRKFYDQQSGLAFSTGENIKEYFSRYITDIRQRKPSTAKHYQDSLQKISRILKEKGIVHNSIYEIGSFEGLENIRKILYHDSDFQDLDQRGHHMYSAGLNHYYKFVSGEYFPIMAKSNQISLLDTPIVAEKPATMEYKVWKRSGILRTQTLEYANYQCAINHSHQTFIAASTHHMYMEAHHIIPLQYQSQFHYTLDNYANLVCLCPICHRKIHLGLIEDRREMIDELYEKRKTRFANSGIALGKEEFERLILS